MSFRSLSLTPGKACPGNEADYQETYEWFLNNTGVNEPNDFFPLISLNQYMELAWKISGWYVTGEFHVVYDQGSPCTLKIDLTIPPGDFGTTFNAGQITENNMTALVCPDTLYVENGIAGTYTETLNCPPQVNSYTVSPIMNLSYTLSGNDLLMGQRNGVYKISDTSYRIAMIVSILGFNNVKTSGGLDTDLGYRFKIGLESGDISLPIYGYSPTGNMLSMTGGMLTTRSQIRLAE